MLKKMLLFALALLFCSAQGLAEEVMTFGDGLESSGLLTAVTLEGYIGFLLEDGSVHRATEAWGRVYDGTDAVTYGGSRLVAARTSGPALPEGITPYLVLALTEPGANAAGQSSRSVTIVEYGLTGPGSEGYQAVLSEGIADGFSDFPYIVSARPVNAVGLTAEKTYGQTDPGLYSLTPVDGIEESGPLPRDDFQYPYPRAGAGDYVGGFESVGSYEVPLDLDAVSAVHPNYQVLAVSEAALTVLPIEALVAPIDARSPELRLESISWFGMQKEAFPTFEWMDPECFFKPVIDELGMSVPVVPKEQVLTVEDQALTWMEYLPVDSVLILSALDPAGNPCVLWTVGEEPDKLSDMEIELTIAPARYDAPELTLDAKPEDFYAPSEAEAGVLYLKRGANLTVRKADGDWVAVAWTVDGQAAQTQYFNDFEGEFPLEAAEGANGHGLQAVSVNYVDELNIRADAAECAFVLDDCALPISREQVSFTNRSKEVLIHLPEMGELIEVRVGKRQLDVDSAMGRSHSVSMGALNPDALPDAKGDVLIRYRDEAGHEGEGKFPMAKAIGALPIRVECKPKLNDDHQILSDENFEYPKLTLKITGTHYELITVTIGEWTKSVRLSGDGAYDSSLNTEGSAEMTLDLQALVDDAALEEAEPYVLTAAYAQVDGPHHESPFELMWYEGDDAGEEEGEGEEGEAMFLLMRNVNWLARAGLCVGVTEGDAEVSVTAKGKTVGGIADETGLFILDIPALKKGDELSVRLSNDEGDTYTKRFTIGDAPGTVTAHPLGVFIADRDEDDAPFGYPFTPLLRDYEGGEWTLPLLIDNAIVVGELTCVRQDSEISFRYQLIEGLTAKSARYALVEYEPDLYDFSDLREKDFTAAEEPGEEPEEGWLYFAIELDAGDVLGAIEQGYSRSEEETYLAMVDTYFSGF